MKLNKKITLSDLKVIPNPFADETKVKAYCSFTVNDAIRMNNVRVVEGDRGSFVSYPSQKGKDGQWYNAVFPITKEMHQQVTEIVLEAFQK